MSTTHPDAVLVRLPDEDDAGLRSRGYRAAQRGELVRLSPGTYVSASEWSALDVDHRYRTLVLAARERLHIDDVVSHWSAAALWQLPIIGDWPGTVHVTAPAASARRSTTVLTRHRRELVDAPVWIDGMPVTSLAETVLDIARVAPFPAALAMGDAALRRLNHALPAGRGAGVSHRELERVLGSADVRRGRARVRRVLGVIDARADRPGESLSRATMIALGVPMPELQHRIVSASAKVYYLDFYWPAQNIGADFDGRIKYLDPTYRGGRTADEVVYDEKVREDEVRLEVTGYGRWDWTVAGSQLLMADRLRRIGLRW
ncbi:MAG: hypothetical protein K2X36_12890 [Microbacteriaceae bacterium]|nr:hypothetical protein [Microbacteriaceae bacterium]